MFFLCISSFQTSSMLSNSFIYFLSYILMSIMLSQVSSTFLIFSHITVVHFYAASSMFMFC